MISRFQQALWSSYQFDPNNVAFNVPMHYQIEGELVVEKLLVVLLFYVEQVNPVAGSVLAEDWQTGGLIAHPVKIKPDVIQAKNADSTEATIHAYIYAPFKLNEAPLCRFLIVQHSAKQHTLIATFHHLAMDTQSCRSFNAFLGEAYAQLVAGANDTVLPTIAAQHFGVTMPQEGERAKAAAQNYWAQSVVGKPLSILWSKTQVPGQFGQQYLQLTPKTVQQVRQICRQWAITPQILYTTLMGLILSRYTHQDCLPVGYALDVRSSSAKPAPGSFVNYLPLWVDVSSKHIHTIFESLRSQRKATKPYQRYPFSDVLMHAGVPIRGEARVLNTVVADSYLQTEALEAGGCHFTHQWISTGNIHDLSFYFDRSNLALVRIDYDQAWFNALDIEYICNSFELGLAMLTHTPDCTVETFLLASLQPVLPKQWTTGQVLDIPDSSVITLIEHMASAYPDTVAIRQGEQALTYQALIASVDETAQQISACIGGGKQIIAFSSQYSLDSIIGVLAIFKAGHIFLPFHPDESPERLAHYMAHTDPALVICEHNLSEAFAPYGSRETLPAIAGLQVFKRKPLRTLEPDQYRHTAYLIFTSGSTGSPKCVQVPHQGLLNTVCAWHEHLKVDHTGTILQFAPLSFDASLFSLFGALCYGATLQLMTGVDYEPSAFTTMLNQHSVTIATLPPSFLANLDPHQFPMLAHLVFAGEKPNLQLIKQWLPGRQLYNAYGPTEASICATVKTMQMPEDCHNIGQPLANTQVKVIGSDGLPVPPGVPGELCLAGAGLAEGYFCDPAATEAVFHRASGQRWYHTGDLVYWNDQGELIFVARTDSQLKVRGFRVDPIELEDVIARHEQVQLAKVIKSPISESLIAYIQLIERPTLDALSQKYREHWADIRKRHLGATGTYEGWQSFITGADLPEAEMAQWVESAVRKISRGQPHRVLELGCGYGLLAEPLVSSLEQYHGVDINVEDITLLYDRLPEAMRSRVTHSQADALSYCQTHPDRLNTFDYIVLNSVAQYFPSPHYFLALLAQLTTQYSGQVLLGDLRHPCGLPRLYQARAEAIQESYPYASLTTAQQCQRLMQDELELVVAPGWVQQAIATCRHVDYCVATLKQMKVANELSQYRYDIELSLQSDQPLNLISLDSQKYQETCGIETYEHPVIMTHCPNPYWHPSLLAQLLALDCEWECMLPPGSEDLSMVDLCLYRGEARTDILYSYYHSVQHQALGLSSINVPAMNYYHMTQPTTTVMTWVKSSLPQFLWPDFIIPLYQFPLTRHGKLDMDQLPLRSRVTTDVMTIESSVGRDLLGIWQDLLGRKDVTTTDDFFFTGGNSILAVQLVHQLENLFSLRIEPGFVQQYSIFSEMLAILETRLETATVDSIEVF